MGGPFLVSKMAEEKLGNMEKDTSPPPSPVSAHIRSPPPRMERQPEQDSTKGSDPTLQLKHAQALDA